MLSEVEQLQTSIDYVSHKVEGSTETQRKRLQDEEEDQDSDFSECDCWVQCCAPDCRKWRKLQPLTDLSALPEDWTCQLNPDRTRSVCAASEESCSEGEEVWSSLVPGALVWAQQPGYPWWPAIVEKDPDTKSFRQFKKNNDLDPCRYHVTYLGEPASRAWVTSSKIQPYTHLDQSRAVTSKSQESYRKKLSEAVTMATRAHKASLKTRLSMFGWLTRSISDRESSEDTDIAGGDQPSYLPGNGLDVNNCNNNSTHFDPPSP
ncbi:zinc finger CW-type PWWP domain protein 1-like [Osmerus mordax]|uniref:zinc finger CW-type PWWP domain protein 1-like n=1 Tax=Osmerus mordax TaxID=8014 RepID=UPI00350EB68E